MKKIVTLVSLLIVSRIFFAQPDSALYNKLNTAPPNCEVIASNSQKLIAGLSFNQPDSIRHIVSVWEKYCGNSEPIERLKILMNIAESKFVDSSADFYAVHYLVPFKDSLRSKIMYRPTGIYFYANKYGSHEYHYTSVDTNFNKFTKSWALNLREDKSRTPTAHLLCTLFSENTDKFDEEFNSDLYKPNRLKTKVDGVVNRNREKSVNFDLAAGVWFPQGGLSNYFSPNGSFGFKVGLPIGNNTRFLIYLNDRLASLNKMAGLYSYSYNNSAISNVNFLSVGGEFRKQFNLKNNFSLDVFVGGGLESMEIYKYNQKNASETDTYGIHTGMSVIKDNWGLEASYHYAPFNLGKDIGSDYISVNLFYRIFVR